MHELSIAHAIVETAEESLGTQGVRVSKLTLQLGELSGVVEDALRFCFDLATAGTALEGCELEIERIPAELYCAPCQRLFHPPEVWRMVCPTCGVPSGDLRAGRDLLILSMEVDDTALVAASR